jgi:hypothetical protein
MLQQDIAFPYSPKTTDVLKGGDSLNASSGINYHRFPLQPEKEPVWRRQVLTGSVVPSVSPICLATSCYIPGRWRWDLLLLVDRAESDGSVRTRKE